MKSRLATKLKLVALLPFGLLTGACFAGHYDVSYSGGHAEWEGPWGGHYDFPYVLSQGFWGGSAHTSEEVFPGLWVVGEPGWTNCHGTITVTFTWDNEGDLSDLPPKKAILRQTSTAWWAGDSGSCSNGLGDPEVLDPEGYGGSSTGTHYEVVSNPGQTFQRQVTPFASSTATEGGPAPLIGSGSGVAYQGLLTPVVLNVVGVTKANGKKNALMGQRLIATLYAEGYELRAPWEYSATGSYYKRADWLPNPAVHHEYIEMEDADFVEPSLSLFYWKDGMQTLTGEAELFINNVSYGRVDAEAQVQIWEPDNYFGHSVVTPNSSIWSGLNPQGIPVEYVITGAWSGFAQISQRGIYFEGRVGTQYMFRSLYGPGKWGMTQTVDSYRSWTLNGQDLGTLDTNQFVLDSFYHYPFENPTPGGPPWWWDEADSTDPIPAVTAFTSDSPAHPLVGNHVVVDDKFRMFQNYIPPSHPSTSCEDVALDRKDWKWAVTATKSRGWSLNAGPHITFQQDVHLPSDTYEWWANIVQWTGSPGGWVHPQVPGWEGPPDPNGGGGPGGGGNPPPGGGGGGL